MDRAGPAPHTEQMKTHLMIRSALLLATLPVLPQTAAAESCVINGSDHSYFFAVTQKNAPRLTKELPPNDRLCGAKPTGATVSVYETADVLEGCSRLVNPGQSDTLITYAEFDRCRWASHTK